MDGPRAEIAIGRERYREIGRATSVGTGPIGSAFAARAADAGVSAMGPVLASGVDDFDHAVCKIRDVARDQPLIVLDAQEPVRRSARDR